MESSTDSFELSNTKQFYNKTEMPHNGSNGDVNSLYYGVHIPSDMQIQDNDGYINVFQDKIEALKVVKKYKKARFKAFSYYHEAAEFAVHGSECPNNNVTIEASFFQKANIENTHNVGEKPSQFRGPKSQDLVKLRKAIESGDIAFVHDTVWENPRYLISSGDTPSILQEGFRYNALHVAAKAKNYMMAELVLNIISNINFIKLLYGDECYQNAEDRAKILLDLYLNTPDKGLNETPLHFAVKFGAAKVVEVLVSYPQCDRNLKNKYGKTPNMIICDRYDGVDSISLKDEIALLLDDNYYVPVLRSEDNCLPPYIGEPFSPTKPPNINSNPLDPRMEIHAYAGPMNREGAEKFRKMWKTPPRSNNFASPVKQRETENLPANSVIMLRYKDPEKGLERLGQNLATKCEIGWKEYWSFLDGFVDITSKEGLSQLENYLSARLHSELDCSVIPCSSSTPKSSGKTSPVVDTSSKNISTISDLCHAFQECNLSDGSIKDSSNIEKHSDIIISDVELLKQNFSPLVCIENSCHVFARRISYYILQLLDTIDTFEIIETQIQQLESLMTSYMDDIRFVSINFHLVHSRLGLLISNKLCGNLKFDNDHSFIRQMIETWHERCTKRLDCFSSDDESVNNKQMIIIKKKSTSKNKQVMCLLECILNTLSNNHELVIAEVNSEDDCSKAWGEAKPCTCIWQTKSSRKSLSRNNSFKYSSRSHVSCYRNDFENVSRKLQFSDLDHNKQKCESIEVISNDDSSDEEYYTPPSSPSILEENEDYDFFQDSQLPESDIYIEGNAPTKTDNAVFKALEYAKCNLNPRDYPNVYKWHHCVSLYSPKERVNWPYAGIKLCNIRSPKVTSTPSSSAKTGGGLLQHSLNTHSRSSPWFRITGANSPKASLRTYNGNVSFNL